MKIKSLIKKLEQLIAQCPESEKQNIKLWIDVKGQDKSIVVKLENISYCGPKYNPVLIGRTTVEDLLT